MKRINFIGSLLYPARRSTRLFMFPGARNGFFTAVMPTARLIRFFAFVTPSMVFTLGLR